MKLKHVVFFAFLLATYCLQAQRLRPKNLPNHDDKRLHFGISLGVNTMDFSIKYNPLFFNVGDIYAIDNIRSTGFHVGAVGDLKLARYFNLRLGSMLTFGQRELQYRVLQDTKSTKNEFYVHSMLIESTFIEFPLHIKYRAARLNNFAPYLLAGVNPKYDLSAQKAIKDEEMPKIKLNNTDLYYEVGCGFDFYLAYFKFATELKFSMGTQDIIVADDTNYSQVIETLNSKMLVLSFTFEY